MANYFGLMRQAGRHSLMQLLGTAFLASLLALPATLFAADAPPKKDLAALLHKLSDPTSDVWALFWEQDWTFSEGDFSNGSRRTGKQSIFQPIMPFEWSQNWKLLTRPTLPIIWSTDIPTGRRFNHNPIGDGSTVLVSPDGSSTFESKEGIGDFMIPMMFSPKKPAGAKWGWGLGPTLVFPTGSNDALTQHTYQAGPAGVLTYKTKKFQAAFLAQYWWDYADTGSSNVGSSHGSFLYSLWWNRPNAWQIGMNPTITYNDKAEGGSDNKWNVPVGLGAAKMIVIGSTPVKLQFAIEKSVVRQDDFGLDWNIRLNIIPVIISPQKKPFFGN